MAMVWVRERMRMGRRRSRLSSGQSCWLKSSGPRLFLFNAGSDHVDTSQQCTLNAELRTGRACDRHLNCPLSTRRRACHLSPAREEACPSSIGGVPKSQRCDIVELPLDPSGAGLWDEGPEHDDLISLSAPGFGGWGLGQVPEIP